MTDTVVFSAPYCSVLADAHVPCVIVQFHAFANDAEFRHVMETALAYYQTQTRPDRPWGWVADVRQMSAIPQEVQTWLTSDWNVRAFAAGIREISIVRAESVIGHLATEQYVDNAVARQHLYEITPAYYTSLNAAKHGARAALAAQ